MLQNNFLYLEVPTAVWAGAALVNIILHHPTHLPHTPVTLHLEHIYDHHYHIIILFKSPVDFISKKYIAKVEFCILSSSESWCKKNLLSSLGTEVLALTLGHALHQGSILDWLSVGQLWWPQQCLQVLRLHWLHLLEILRSTELTRGHLTQEPSHTLLVLQPGDCLKQRTLAMRSSFSDTTQPRLPLIQI